MFKEFVEKKHYSFHEGFDDWRDAVRAACAPLLADGTIEKEYPEIIIEKVEELGPYIVIAPNICIPHAERGRGVNDTAMCFMKTEKPVSFDPNDPDKDARIFVVLAATDDEVHLNNLMALSETLSDEDIVAKVLEAKTPEDLLKIEG
ncbi:MAG: PTS sugar transporter subunit IIA [Selenomonas sp.]|jgi:PTS system ascorbate-specific IIA component|uniref:PTS sugar transporter subunit IIA n=1 Tax=Selenomonas ruminantium TaxID=971 RepID=UPI0004090DA2|nr:PTS sugar transporter subunit IIA [Selenomonas ruminantium]MBQ1614508.1 PTS sugar transporter subunit IIA [Selenomonas sp.]MBQ1920016.1 PTS sugar transporter subunit IIA [Selenomonas sp.]MBQ4212679.1 PTS sugar transporter subunit IIA [Selenomonas sp.]MBQ5418560.1 PTS sugar transporter subunit IIA [Selenomonas sp.]MBQ5503239.1 PTS sugar transporter subunit IIA [Selenomonas sp.]